MTDIYITITDENMDVLRVVNIYFDGSDSETANEIADNIIKSHAGAVNFEGSPYVTHNSVATLAFTVEHDTAEPRDSISINHIRRRLISRIADLDENDEWLDALHFDDTVKGSLYET